MQFMLVQLIKFYRFVISPWVGHHCRFYPTCSSYALTAIERFGALRGSYLTIIRLSKCHPWHEGGLDPVPEKFGGKHHG
jgi:hypothetical protein